MPLPPLTFTPILKQRAWGGERLRAFGKRVGEGVPIGESWELADLPASIPDGRSVVFGGSFDGSTLRSIIKADPEGVLGRAQPGPDGGFPLLVKLLDARENLSVQLHPSPAYAAEHPEAHLKTETWVVLAAEEGAQVYAGVSEQVDRAGFRSALESGAVRELLVATTVRAGDCIFLESGLCHALGAGIVVAEIQTPSDTTFRVWDWNRNDPNRPLHIEQALECVRLGTDQESDWPRVVRSAEARCLSSGALQTRTLVDCSKFRLERFERMPDANGPVAFDFPTNGMPHVFMSTEGDSSIEGSRERVALPRGTTVLLPASAEAVRIELGVRDNPAPSLLHAVPPDPLRDSIA